MLWFLQQRASAENKNGLKRGAMKDAAVHFECSAKLDTALQKLQPSE